MGRSQAGASLYSCSLSIMHEHVAFLLPCTPPYPVGPPRMAQAAVRLEPSCTPLQSVCIHVLHFRSHALRHTPQALSQMAWAAARLELPLDTPWLCALVSSVTLRVHAFNAQVRLLSVIVLETVSNQQLVIVSCNQSSPIAIAKQCGV